MNSTSLKNRQNKNLTLILENNNEINDEGAENDSEEDVFSTSHSKPTFLPLISKQGDYESQLSTKTTNDQDHSFQLSVKTETNELKTARSTMPTPTTQSPLPHASKQIIAPKRKVISPIKQRIKTGVSKVVEGSSLTTDVFNSTNSKFADLSPNYGVPMSTTNSKLTIGKRTGAGLDALASDYKSRDFSKSHVSGASSTSSRTGISPIKRRKNPILRPLAEMVRDTMKNAKNTESTSSDANSKPKSPTSKTKKATTLPISSKPMLFKQFTAPQVSYLKKTLSTAIEELEKDIEEGQKNTNNPEKSSAANYSHIYEFKFGQQNNEFGTFCDPRMLKMTIKDYLSDFHSCKMVVKELFEKFGHYHEEDKESDKNLMLLSTTKIFFEKYSKNFHELAYLQSKKRILVEALRAVDEFLNDGLDEEEEN